MATHITDLSQSLKIKMKPKIKRYLERKFRELEEVQEHHNRRLEEINQEMSQLAKFLDDPDAK